VTIIYNISISLALYALYLFYCGVREILSPYRPVLKFIIVKSIVFVPFWQSVGLAIAEELGIIHKVQGKNGDIQAGVVAMGYQNFIITIEMFFGAILLCFAFPYKIYLRMRLDEKGRGIPMQKISAKLVETLNPKDIVEDAVHNFIPVYHRYALQTGLAEDLNQRETKSARTQYGNHEEEGEDEGEGEGEVNERTCMLTSDTQI
jgi:hypothetical protein